MNIQNFIGQGNWFECVRKQIKETAYKQHFLRMNFVSGIIYVLLASLLILMKVVLVTSEWEAILMGHFSKQVSQIIVSAFQNANFP